MTNHNEGIQFPPPDAAEEFYAQEPQFPTPLRAIDPDNPSWGVGSAIFVLLTSLILSIFIPVIFLVPYASYRGISPGSPDYLPVLTQFAMSDKTAVLIQVLALLPIHILTVLLVWALVTRFGKQSFWEALGWGWAPRFRLWSCIGLGVLLFMVASFVAKWLGAETPTQLEQVINSSYAARIAISFLAVCTAPFVEEFVYRGVLYSALRRGIARLGGLIFSIVSVQLDPKSKERMGVVGAVVIVLALFTLIHVPQYWPNVGVIAAVGILSVALTLIRAYSGKLLPCIAIHLVFNGIQAVILLVEPYAKQFLPPAVPPPDPAALVIHLIGFIN